VISSNRSDVKDADKALPSGEVIAVSSVEIEAIGVRGRRDQQVGESAPRLPSFTGTAATTSP
jgi:hypothetical protein